MDRKVAIVGVAQTDFGQMYREKDAHRDQYALAGEAFCGALEDAGLQKDEIDGLICARVNYTRMATVLGLRNLRVVNGFEGTGRMSGVAVREAVALVSTGAAEVVACVYGNNGRSVRMKYGGEGGGPTVAYDAMYGMTSPGAYVAMMYRRYRQFFGSPDDALAPIAINNRRHASLNPAAVMREEIDHDQYMASRMIADPLRLLDYCIINDGGVACIVTTEERARNLRKQPVIVAGTSGASDLTNFYTSADFFYGACQSVAKGLRAQTGIGPDDVDCLQVYDNFTPIVLFSLEGFNYAERGAGWQWVREHDLGFDGDKPLNTAGGHTGESYMQGWSLHVESVRQLRGEGGDRQVADCNVVQYVCASPIVTSHILTAG